MPRNIEKVKAARRKWYANNKEHVVSKVLERRSQILEWFQEQKKLLKCNRCGGSHVALLDFHHIDPEQKDMSVAKAVHDGWSRDRILKEIEKCEVLCCRCHRLHHWDERIRSVV